MSAAKRQNLSSGSKWEPLVGYSRATKIGNFVAVSGTTAAGETLEEQVRGALTIIRESLEKMGLGLDQVLRTRIFCTDASQWETIGKVHAEFFGDIRPATTILGIKALVDPSLMVEIEADAWAE